MKPPDRAMTTGRAPLAFRGRRWAVSTCGRKGSVLKSFDFVFFVKGILGYSNPWRWLCPAVAGASAMPERPRPAICNSSVSEGGMRTRGSARANVRHRADSEAYSEDRRRAFAVFRQDFYGVKWQPVGESNPSYLVENQVS